jgi:citrate synthase
MSDNKNSEAIHTRIWLEEPEPDNDFATKAAFCNGYDVYGEMLGNASWSEMVYLLFRGEAPNSKQIKLFDALAVAVANPGPRDQSVYAAMCGGVGGSTAAACLIAALSVGAGHLSGSREVFLTMESWKKCGTDIDAWANHLNAPPDQSPSIWPAPEHPSGFEPYSERAATIVTETLYHLAQISSGNVLPWLHKNRQKLEEIAKHPISMSGVAAAALSEMEFTPEQGEMLYLVLRLPGAAAHALEQWRYGHKKFPFFKLVIENDPMKETK